VPLVALAVIAYAAGLLLGFGGVVHPAIAMLGCITVAVAGVVRRDAGVSALAILGLAGWLAARSAMLDEARCARLRGPIIAVFPEAVAPGAFVRGETRAIAGRTCTAPITVAVRSGRASAGREVHVVGDVAATHGRLFARGASVRPGRDRDEVVAFRARLGHGLDSAFGRNAALARALLIADTRSIDPAVRDRYAAAGLVHMLSISGLHVAIIALAVELLCRAARLPPRAASITTMALVAAYVVVIGAPAPAVRSAVMLGVSAVSRLAQRNTSPWASLAIGGGAPLLLPRTVLDLGWQLSVLGMAGLVASGALARRWIGRRRGAWRGQVQAALLASIVASLVSGPLVAWHFGRLSLVAPLANVVASPIVAVLQPTLFLALAFTSVAAVERFIADAASPMLWALDAVASTASRVPYASLNVAPSLGVAVIASLCALALLVACVSRHPGRPLVVAGGSLAAIAWWPLAPLRARGVELHMIDVGQGDAIALRTPRGRWVLVDAGRAWRGGDAGRATVIPYVRRHGGSVAAFVLSHPHADHAGGAATIVRALRPEAFWDGAYLGTSDTYRDALAAVAAAGITWERARPGHHLLIDDVQFEFLAPDSAWTRELDDPNEASVVLRVRYGAVRFLLVGDAERGEERWLLARDSLALRAEVLKVGHHGSSTSTTAEFLRAVRPVVALVSVGAGNAYGHPSAHVLGSLAAQGATVLRTDRQGTVVVRTDGVTVEIQAQGERWVSSAVSAPH
jgi:competence protein ComEC